VDVGDGGIRTARAEGMTDGEGSKAPRRWKSVDQRTKASCKEVLAMTHRDEQLPRFARFIIAIDRTG